MGVAGMFGETEKQGCRHCVEEKTALENTALNQLVEGLPCCTTTDT
jgi:hypothetical protein